MQHNDLIAHFMGGEIISKESSMTPHGSYSEMVIDTWKIPEGIPFSYINTAKIGIFNYHNDWECLIPVIEKIETIQIDDELFRIVPYMNKCTIEAQCVFLRPSTIWHIHYETKGRNKIEATYMAVVQFIKSLNKK